MWKILHRIFGIDYVYCNTERVCRIHVTPNGKPYIRPYGIIMPEMMFLDELKNEYYKSIIFLTCDKSKYIKE